MAELTGGFSSFSGITTVVKYGGIFVLMLLIGLAIAGIVIFILVQMKKKKILEINLVNRRVRTFTGREKKTGSGIKNFFASKIGRFIPNVQEKYKLFEKNRELIPLIKDNNGMYHTVRFPTFIEIKKWYAAQHGLNLNDKKIVELIKDKQKNWEEVKDIYFLPNPHENLEWLGTQCVEANTEFKYTNWWQSPVVMVLGTTFICFIMFVATMIISKRM